MGRRRPKGKCQLCGKMIWGRAVRYDIGFRHPECVPGKGGLRYGIARKEGQS